MYRQAGTLQLCSLHSGKRLCYWISLSDLRGEQERSRPQPTSVQNTSFYSDNQGPQSSPSRKRLKESKHGLITVMLVHYDLMRDARRWSTVSGCQLGDMALTTRFSASTTAATQHERSKCPSSTSIFCESQVTSDLHISLSFFLSCCCEARC
ncbi:hypothetical protein LY76DRAFT_153393 [Colletotrichum caudatum]|nr:hypothetical protein LY76DRAFT_153393 [Colletotrichum caudatum]